MYVLTKLWVEVYQGEDKGEDEGDFFIFLLSEESYEADNVVEQEWNQHRCSHVGVRGKTVQFVDKLDVGERVPGWQCDVED